MSIQKESTMKPFPLNAWYAAAYDVEVKQALLARTRAARAALLAY
jgi:vanillate O-demethylase monooxygenase subunit